MKKDIRIANAYADSDGAWIELVKGYHLDNVHCIHEDIMIEALKRLSEVEICNCKDCVKCDKAV